MTTQFEQDRAAVEASEQRGRNLVTYKNWLTKNPSVVDCIANQKAFEEYMDWSDEFTEADLTFALGNMEGQLAIGRVPTPEETKAALIGKITALTSKDGKSQGITFKLSVDGGKRVVHWSIPQLATWNIPQLVELLDEIVRKRELVTQSSSDLQQIVESARPNYGYPQLPKQIVRPGTVRAVPLDAAFLRGQDTYELKKFIRLYGLEQVNARLAGKEQ